MRKRICAMLLMICMLITMLPVTGQAASSGDLLTITCVLNQKVCTAAEITVSVVDWDDKVVKEISKGTGELTVDKSEFKDYSSSIYRFKIEAQLPNDKYILTDGKFSNSDFYIYTYEDIINRECILFKILDSTNPTSEIVITRPCLDMPVDGTSISVKAYNSQDDSFIKEISSTSGALSISYNDIASKGNEKFYVIINMKLPEGYYFWENDSNEYTTDKWYYDVLFGEKVYFGTYRDTSKAYFTIIHNNEILKDAKLTLKAGNTENEKDAQTLLATSSNGELEIAKSNIPKDKYIFLIAELPDGYKTNNMWQIDDSNYWCSSWEPGMILGEEYSEYNIWVSNPDIDGYLKSNIKNNNIMLAEGESIDLSGAFNVNSQNDEFQLIYVAPNGTEQRVVSEITDYGWINSSEDSYEINNNVLTVKNSTQPIWLNFETPDGLSFNFTINEKTADNFYFTVMNMNKRFKSAKITAILKDAENSESGTELATSLQGILIIPKESIQNGKWLEIKIELPAGYRECGNEEEDNIIRYCYSTDELLEDEWASYATSVYNPSIDGTVKFDTTYMSTDKDGFILLNKGESIDLSGAFEINDANDELQMIYTDANGNKQRVVSEDIDYGWLNDNTENWKIENKILTAKSGDGEFWLYFDYDKRFEVFLKVRTTDHKYGEWIIDKEATCVDLGSMHRDCSDSDCNYTDTRKIKLTGHKYYKKTTPATPSKNGSIEEKCSVCGAVKSKTVIYSPTKVTLSKTSYTYNGKAQKPTVTVKDSKGKTLKNGTDYTVSYSSGCKKVGQYTVTIKYKGNYSGTANKTYTILPKGTSLSGLKAATKKITVKWKKQATETTGYEVQYSTSKKFTAKTTKLVKITSNKTTSKAITKLAAKKKYYVRIRTYKTVKINGKSKKLYSSWSAAKNVKTK